MLVVADSDLPQLFAGFSDLPSSRDRLATVRNVLRSLDGESLSVQGREARGLRHIDVVVLILHRLGICAAADDWEELKSNMMTQLRERERQRTVNSNSIVLEISSDEGEDESDAQEQEQEQEQVAGETSRGRGRSRSTGKYDGLPERRLKDLLRRRDGQISKMRGQLKVHRQRERRVAAARIAAESKAAEAASSSSLVVKLAFGPRKESLESWFSPATFMAIAIRRNFANISTAAFGPTVLSELSRQTVARAEVYAGTLMAAAGNLFYRAMQQQWSAPALEAAASFDESQASGGHLRYCHY